MSLHGIAGEKFHTHRSSRSFEDYVFDRDHVRLPEVVIDREPADEAEAAVALRPLLDGLWNAVGAPACEYFDSGGSWVPPR